MKLDMASYYHGNLTDTHVENLLADIWFKQVEPLLISMKENQGIVSFVSEKFCFDAKEIVNRIVKQKKEYYRLIEDLKSFEPYPLSAQEQTYIFSIAQRALAPALQYGYANEAVELLRVMKSEKLSGVQASSKETSTFVAEALDRIVAIYGLRFKKEEKEYLKVPVRDLINEIIVGKFGEVENASPQHYKHVFNNPERTLDFGFHPKRVDDLGLVKVDE